MRMRDGCGVILFLALIGAAPTARSGDPAAADAADLWSLRPLSRPAVPPARAATRARGPVDGFLLARLDAEGIAPAPPADRRTLLRRASFDLLGLPPDPGDIDAFAADPSPDAWERLLDRLLASPHHGERWGRHWLDLVRFAETNGYERDAAKPHAWRYRDWVIASLNADTPYDRFVLEQLAGDELPDRTEETVIATGLMRLGTWDDEPNVPEEYTYERLEDLVHTTSSAFLAMTVKCARCHDHKFDPIPQSDYYRFASVFWAGHVEPRARELMGGPSAEELGFDVLGWTDRGREVPPLRVLESGDPHRPLDAVAPGALSMVGGLDPDFEEPPAESRTTTRRLQLARWIVDRRNPLTARVVVNRLWQHHFGHGIARTPSNFGRTGSPPSHPELLDWLATELVDGDWRFKRLHRTIMASAAYRMASTHPDHERLVERDADNRLLWRFDRRRLDAEALRDAMLAAAGDLDGRIGGPSFYPVISPEALEGLSRKGDAWGSSPPEERRRRSVYIFTKRSLLAPLMTVFDFCDTTTSCAGRDVTTVAPQALALLNNGFVHERSLALARRVAREAGDDRRRRVERAWERALGRPPSDSELGAALDHLEEQYAYYLANAGRAAQTPPAPPGSPEELALASLCHVLLNANEFIYVD